MYTKLKLSRMNGVGYGRNEKCKQNFRENLKGTDQYKDFFFHGSTAPVGLGLLTVQVSRSHSGIPQSVGLPWTRDWPDTETST